MMKLIHAPFTLLLHIALLIIVSGAIVTHFCGIRGTLDLTEGEDGVDTFHKSSGPGDGRLPFRVSLISAEILYYPATTTPMDFRSTIRIGTDTIKTVAMNKVVEVDGWRFYQSCMAAGSSTLSVTYDPLGISITYTGYLILFIGMAGFFLQKHTLWRGRGWWRARHTVVTLFLLISPLLHASAEFSAMPSGTSGAPQVLPTMQRPLARNLGHIYVYWNDRITPLQTMAYDVTAKLYDSKSYKGLTAEQVLAGWLFYYDEWLADYKCSAKPSYSDKAKKKEQERQALIQWLGTGEAFKIYPYQTAGGDMEWLSLTGRRPSYMELEQWQFMVGTMPHIKTELMQGHNIRANQIILTLREGQRRYAGIENLPSETRFNLEIFYNRYVRLWIIAVLILIVSLSMLMMTLKGVWTDRLGRASALFSSLATGIILAILFARGYISGHLPLVNGCETMLFMAFAASAISLLYSNPLLRGSLLLVSAISLFVASMSGKTPQIGSLMPVLDSPLLSIHVILVMCSYVIFMLMAILAAIGLASDKEMRARATRLNRVLLTPGVFLIAGGIFVGAVWANQSWGRYWGWDPKETCALVTMLIYAIPIHSRSLRMFRRDKTLNIYLLSAILSVAFTYFGANYLLPGLHSYA